METADGVAAEGVAVEGVAVAVPPPPEPAVRLLGAALPALVRYVDLLAGAGVERGLIGPREVPRLWTRHILNCAVVEELVPPRAQVVDLGSGAGLPGLVLAMCRPDTRVVLLEPLLKRTVFLAECMELLEIRNVDVVRCRAEEWGRRPGVDVVTARAVAPLERLCGWAVPLLRGGGQLLAIKGESAAHELEEATSALRRAGAEAWSLVRVGAGVVEPETTVIRVTKASGGRPATTDRAHRGSRQQRRPGRPGGGGQAAGSR